MWKRIDVPSPRHRVSIHDIFYFRRKLVTYMRVQVHVAFAGLAQYACVRAGCEEDIARPGSEWNGAQREDMGAVSPCDSWTLYIARLLGAPS